MLKLNGLSLQSLPSTETEELEYKSSLIKDDALKSEIQNAASAFWNSGGGVFFVGINDQGKVDGGIARNIGHQSREDWADNVLASVHPRGKRTVKLFEHGTHSGIHPGRCVLGIEFHESPEAPHQSSNRIYYIRAGAHTVPAPHFVVDALYARRNTWGPKLVALESVEFDTTEHDFLQIEIVAASDGVAFDVEIDLDPSPAPLHRTLPTFPIRVALIDRGHPFAFRVAVPKKPNFVSSLKIKYLDFSNTLHSTEKTINCGSIVSPYHILEGPHAEIARNINSLTRAIEMFRHSIH